DEIALEKLGKEKYEALKDKQEIKEQLRAKNLENPLKLEAELNEKFAEESSAWNPLGWIASAKGSINNVIATLVPDTWGMSKEDEIKYREVNDSLFRIQKPIAQEKDRREKNRIQTLQQKLVEAETNL